ncbi:unnamed protein product [Symbiodinium natans]|uniref:Uncharacterized protein n=1 Tax=Symbiodinium natans TaxID=878477 RepID=A0A812QAJ5_9DINO|nr:unnamed protein product [Symbiodinium natans]
MSMSWRTFQVAKTCQDRPLAICELFLVNQSMKGSCDLLHAMDMRRTDAHALPAACADFCAPYFGQASAKPIAQLTALVSFWVTRLEGQAPHCWFSPLPCACGLCWLAGGWG